MERINDYNTSYLKRSTLIHSEKVSDNSAAELMLFKILSDYRIREDREMFDADPEIIIEAMKKVAAHFNINKKRVNETKVVEKFVKVDKSYVSKSKKINIFCLRCGYHSYDRSYNVRKHLKNKKTCKVKYLNVSQKNILNNYEKCCILFVSKVKLKDEFPDYIKQLYEKIDPNTLNTCDQCGKILKCAKNMYRHKREHCPNRPGLKPSVEDKLAALQSQVNELMKSQNISTDMIPNEITGQ